jgi:hypothetical protein
VAGPDKSVNYKTLEVKHDSSESHYEVSWGGFIPPKKEAAYKMPPEV